MECFEYLAENHFCGLVCETGQPIYGRSCIVRCEENGSIYYMRIFDIGLNLWEFVGFSDLKLKSGEIVKVYQGGKRKLIEADIHFDTNNLRII